MKKLLKAILACTILATTLSAQGAISYESITVANTAIGITSSVYTVSGKNASKCVGSLETAQVRVRLDGTNPTTSEGVLVEIGQTVTLDGFVNIKAFRAIRTGSTSGVLKVHCYAY